MAGKSNVKLKRDRWTAADRTAMALGCAMAVVVVVVGLRWWMSLDAWVAVLAALNVDALFTDHPDQTLAALGDRACPGR